MRFFDTLCNNSSIKHNTNNFQKMVTKLYIINYKIIKVFIFRWYLFLSYLELVLNFYGNEIV